MNELKNEDVHVLIKLYNDGHDQDDIMGLLDVDGEEAHDLEGEKFELKLLDAIEHNLKGKKQSQEQVDDAFDDSQGYEDSDHFFNENYLEFNDEYYTTD